jgi:hypothetical protein
MTCRKFILMLLGLILFSPPADAVPVVDFTGGGAEVAGSSSVVGWEFSVSSAITIDALGFWDEAGDGLNTAHDVGLWNGDGTTLLTSTTVNNSSTPAASTSPDGFWRFQSISPLVLVPGNYVVAATVSNFDPLRNGLFFALPITTIPDVSFIESRFLGVPALAYPPSAIGIDSFGPNLRLGDDVVLPGLGLTGIGALVSILGILGGDLAQRRAAR